MRISSGAGRWLAPVLCAALTLAGCGSPSDTRAITALVARFMDILAPAGGAPPGANLDEIFTGLDPTHAQSPLEGMAAMPPDLSYTIRELKFFPFGGASVVVALDSEAATSTLELRARKVGGEWRLEPSFRVRQKLDDVRVPEP
jgi:hypothetical protein